MEKGCNLNKLPCKAGLCAHNIEFYSNTCPINVLRNLND